MECRDAQRLITSFIDNKLNDNQLKEFLDHVSSCSECYDELEVYYTMLVGTKQLYGDTLVSQDLLKDLKERISNDQRRLHKKHLRRVFVSWFFGTCIAMLLLFVVIAISSGIFDIR